MLVLSSKVGERIVVFDGEEPILTITVIDRKQGRVRLGYECSERFGVWREALLKSHKEDDHAEEQEDRVG